METFAREPSWLSRGGTLQEFAYRDRGREGSTSGRLPRVLGKTGIPQRHLKAMVLVAALTATGVTIG